MDDTIKQLKLLVLIQLNNFFEYEDDKQLDECINRAITRMQESMGALAGNREGLINPYHTVRWSFFLYLLSNELGYAGGESEKADKVYYLNKIMNSVEWYWGIYLPKQFWAEHPIGSVLGRAVYGDYFFVYQGCTVGGNRKSNELFYPIIGHHVVNVCRCIDNLKIKNRELFNYSSRYAHS